MNIANRLANMVNADLEAISVVNKGYKEQFHEAMNVNGGEIEGVTAINYFKHVLAFPWKVRILFIIDDNLFNNL